MQRREILIGAAAATAALATPAWAQPARPYRVGVVGVGWFGKLNCTALMQVAPVEVVAIADVDRTMLTEARDHIFERPDSVNRQRRRPAIYEDYREMLRRHRFDIVIVATPDHWHTLPAIAALEAGAHVYVEKPVSVDVREGEALVAAARRTGKTVQVGTQRRNAPPFLDARERIIRSGLIGTVRHIELSCYYPQRPAQFSEPSTPPSTLDWDMYCGPAPLIPYRREMHPRDWRAFEGFGNGYLGDVGVHFIDLTRWITGLGAPKRIHSVGGVYVQKSSPATVPDLQIASFEFDDVLMTWTNRHWGRGENPNEPWSGSLHGENGTLILYPERYEYHPREGDRIAGNMPDQRTLYPADTDSQGLRALTRYHMQDFLAAITEGRRPASDIEEGHISTACCVLANASMKLGRPLRWDGTTVIDDPEANALLRREYRAPWVHPAGA